MDTFQSYNKTSMSYTTKRIIVSLTLNVDQFFVYVDLI